VKISESWSQPLITMKRTQTIETTTQTRSRPRATRNAMLDIRNPWADAYRLKPTTTHQVPYPSIKTASGMPNAIVTRLA
jgi:hypothetical protein